ncbi:MAG: ribosomal RNA small subunit methyltransferase H [Candidatus Hepatoplasma vulgare]|nr:MAG: ribosomal RNA small subunit methyltransferase H [Candidatus Hepatoplasma sp.]
MFYHNSILINEVIKRLEIKDNGIYIDATLGLGGHSEAILKKNKTIKIIAFDQDEKALEFAKKRLKKFTNITFINKNFNKIEETLKELKIEKVDGILFDLGTSYYQLTTEDRGFSYHGENILLDMRMNQKQEKDAIKILNEYDLNSLTKIFKEYGDEKRASYLAKIIIEAREKEKILTNTTLNEIIKKTKGYDKRKHPSKNIFQALRIETNDEISNLKSALNQSLDVLKKGGIIIVISFHSLEDRTIKKIFGEAKKIQEITPFEIKSKFKTSKSIRPTKEEIEKNKQARSAKLRSIKKYYE